jgi:hypothetical protein
MLSGHYVVEPATESGVVITCLSEQEQTFVMVSNAVIEHRVGRGLLNGAQKRHHVVEHAMEFIALARQYRYASRNRRYPAFIKRTTRRSAPVMTPAAFVVGNRFIV